MSKAREHLRAWATQGVGISDTAFAMCRDLLLTLPEHEFLRFKNMAAIPPREFWRMRQEDFSPAMATLIRGAFCAAVASVCVSAINHMCDCTEDK